MIPYTGLLHFLEFNKPFLVVGKGPSFSKIWDLDKDDWNIIGLNHVAHVYPTDITHFIDYDVFSTDLFRRSKLILTPVHQHTNFRPRKEHTQRVFGSHVYKNFFLYNATTWKGTHDKFYGPPIRVRYFSSEVVFRILGLLGVKEFSTIGIDGGDKYAKEFSGMGLKPLTNKQKSFDIQFKELTKICKKFSMEWAKI